MDPLESARCPQCSEVYSVRGLHLCTKGTQSLSCFDPSRYAQHGAVSFQVVVLQNQHCEHGEQQNRRDLVLGGSDGRVVIDIIKATALVRWVTRAPHPKAREYKNGNNYGEQYPDTISTEHVEPHECLIAVIGESKDSVVAELRRQLEAKREEAEKWFGQGLTAKNEAVEATKKLAEKEKETEAIERRAERYREDYNATAKAKTEAERLVKELQAELARIKTKVGTERFDELRKA